MSTQKRIIVALDGLSKEETFSLIPELSDLVWGFKAHELFIREGLRVVDDLKKYGNVFADFKLHDIPATVEKEVAALVERGVDLATVHASGGKAMLEAAVNAGGDKVVAVTVLTSLAEDEVQNLFGGSSKDVVRKFTTRAHNAGVSNIVCSPLEIKVVKEVSNNLTAIVPGIRQNNTDDDQKRTMAAKDAVQSGADLLVIGRPITKAPNPRSALEDIISTIS